MSLNTEFQHYTTAFSSNSGPSSTAGQKRKNYFRQTPILKKIREVSAYVLAKGPAVRADILSKAEDILRDEDAANAVAFLKIQKPNRITSDSASPFRYFEPISTKPKVIDLTPSDDMEIVEIIDDIRESQKQIIENNNTMVETLQKIEETADKIHPLAPKVPSILKRLNSGQILKIRKHHAPYMGNDKQMNPYLKVAAQTEEVSLHNQALDLLSQNKLTEAQPILDKILEKYPYALADRLLRADIYLNQDAYDLALQDLKIVLSIEPLNQRALSLEGVIRLRQGELQRAKQSFEKIKNTLQNTGLLACRCYFYLKIGESDKAQEDLKQLSLVLQKENPIHSQTELTCLAEIHFLLKNKEKAAKYVNRALKLNPNNKYVLALKVKIQALASSPVNKQELEQIAAALKVNNNQLALQLLNSTLEKSPDSTSYLFLRAKALSRMTQYQEALADLEKCLEVDPSSPTLLAYKGEILSRMNLLDDARVCFSCIDETLFSDPKHLIHRLKRCIFYIYDKQIDKLGAELLHSERMFNQLDAETKTFDHFILLGEIYYFLKQPEKALPYLLKANAIGNNNELVSTITHLLSSLGYSINS